MYPNNASIHSLFSQKATETPNAIALQYEDKILTYAELDNKANHVAHRLKELGIKKNELVGICIERSFELVIGILAILKLGAACVPLDFNYPITRLMVMLEDTETKTIVITKKSKYANKLEKHTLFEIGNVNVNGFPNPLNTEVDADSPAYVIYTSGTTARPKGVVATHRGVISLLVGQSFMQFNSNNIFLHISPITFDASTFEIWGALLHGARCAILPEQELTVSRISSTIKKYKINTLFLTTALFNLMIDENPSAFKDVKQLLTGGEAHSISHMQKACSINPGNLNIYHVYGPTESTTFSTYYHVTQADNFTKPIPIGKAIAHRETYVLDKNRSLVKQGMIGELYIGGDGLAQGYLNKPILTQENFIYTTLDKIQQRLYKTGDLVQLLEDGNIVFIKRNDTQVKINGFRIELEEIEYCLNQHPDINQSCVVVQKQSALGKVLVAYVVTFSPSLVTEHIKSFLANYLPHYSIPSIIQTVRSLPLTTNGKINRNYLENLEIA